MTHQRKNIVLVSITVIVAAGLMALNPSTLIANSQAELYSNEYGYDNNYYQDDNRYSYDNNHQKKSYGDIQKIKCVNSNINVNGVDITQIPRDDIAGVAAANEGGTANAANAQNGNGLADRINFDRNLVNICVNVNANEQIRITPPPPPPIDITETLTVIKTVDCQADTQTCQQNPIQPSQFNIIIQQDNNPSQTSFAGSSAGTNVELEPGPYSVSEQGLDPTTPTICTIMGFEAGSTLENNLFICTNFSDECKGDIAIGNPQTCTIDNVLVIRNDVGIDVGAFFYPWYGKYRQWTNGGHNPPITWASNYLPDLFNSQYPNYISDNLYSSNDTNVIKKQIQLMNDTGIEFGIVSWWGQNTYEDMVFNKIINEVHPTIEGNGYNKFRWATLYEDEGFGDPTVTELVNDLNYIKQNYASSPYYLHVNGKPVIFVYNAAHSGYNPLGDLERWKEAKAQVPFYVVFKVDPLAQGANPNDMDSWYQYAPASKYFEQQKTYSAFVSPGFWKYHENVRLPAANSTEFENAVSKLKQAQVTWKLVETWNELHEGTGIEPAQQIIHDDINGFELIPNQPPSQQYIEIFKRYFK